MTLALAGEILVLALTFAAPVSILVPLAAIDALAALRLGGAAVGNIGRFCNVLDVLVSGDG